MFFGQLLILQLFIFAGLILFLRSILTRNITRATGHLQELGEDYARKQKEAETQLEKAKKDAAPIVAEARSEGGALKSKLSQEAEKEKERISQETRKKSEEMMRQTEKTCELLKREIEQQIEKGSSEKAGSFLREALPDKIQQELHSLWFKESMTSDFQLERIHLPDNISRAKVVSPFPLTSEQQGLLRKGLEKKFGRNIDLKEEVDPQLIAGMVITIGSVVIDGSLKHRIQKIAKNA